MSRDRDPYERTLDLLRRRLRAGAFGHGQPLHILKLAQEMTVSSTPIREALARLAGEGLIDRAATGYLTLRHDAGSVVELYRLDEIYALAALPSRRGRDGRSSSSPRGGVPEGGYLERTEILLARLGIAQSRTLWAARRNLWDRLAPLRQAEPVVLEDVDAELQALERQVASQVRAKFIRAYYRRRTRAAATILSAASGRI